MTRVEKWVIADRHRIEPTWPEEQNTGGVKDALRSFDTRQGVIRDIRYIQSRFVGLHITQDNLGAFLKSTSSEQKSKELTVSLLTHLVECWRVKGETLTALESDWTGKDRGLEYRDQESTFLVVATVAAYFTTDWEQTRELSYIAVEEGAMGRLLKYTGLNLADGDALSDFPFVDKAAFSDILRVLRREEAAGANLLACISRVCLSTGILSTKNDEYKDVLTVPSVERLGHGLMYRADTVLKPDTATKRDFVRRIYTEHKIGRNEPFCPFLRVSSVLDELGLSPEAPPLCVDEIQHSRWFKRTPNMLEIPDHGVLIATSSNPIAEPVAARLCLFVTNPAAVRTSGSPFRELVQSEPPWFFRAKTYCDKERGGPNRWNCEFEKCVKYTTRDEHPMLPRLNAFVEALEMLEARSPGGDVEADAGVNKDNTGRAWAPKKPNSMWDVLLAPVHAFVSGEENADTDAVDNSPAYPTMANNPRNIRPVNREDTPRPSVEPQSRGKQPEVIQQRGFSHYRGNGSPWPQGSRSMTILTDKNPSQTQSSYHGVRDDGPGSSNSALWAARRKTPETESPAPPSKRQRSNSPPHRGSPVREALPHRGLTPIMMQTADQELHEGNLNRTLLHTSQPLPFYSANCGSKTDPIVIL